MGIISVILAGGQGSRLRPFSSKKLPKQFLRYNHDEDSFFQKAINRSRAISSPSEIIISTNVMFKEHVTNLQDNKEYKFIYEPLEKNTAAAFLYAALYAYEQHGNKIVFFFPADHVIEDKKFIDYVKNACQEVDKDKLYCFGIKPSTLTTDFGYMILNKGKIQEFIEKPSLAAIEKIKKDEFCCNSGIYFGYLQSFLDAFRKTDKNFFEQMYSIYRASLKTNTSISPPEKLYKDLESISFDKKISEKVNNLFVKEINCLWNDIGNFKRFWQEGKIDDELVLNFHVDQNELESFFDSKNDFDYSYLEKKIILRRG